MRKNNCNIIRDGVNLPGFIEAHPDGLYGECRFSYRPMLPEETEELEYYREAEQNKPKEMTIRLATAMAERIKSWGEQYDDGSPVPISKDTVRRMPIRLFTRMYRIIAQFDVSDKDPSLGDLVDEGREVSLRELEGN